MTTPAINRNEFITLNCQHEYQYGGNAPIRDTVPYLDRVYLQARPASKTNPRRQDGTRPPGQWVHQLRKSASEICTVRYTDRSSLPYYTHTYTGAFPASPGVIQRLAPSPDPKVMQSARLKALAALKDQKVNLGVALAEARQTAELVGSAATDIAKQIDRFRNRHPKDWVKRSSWKKTPARYLEMSYGWTPLLSDVDGACRELAELVNKQRQVPQVTAVGRAHLNDVITVEEGGRDFMRTSRLRVRDSAYVSLVGKAPSWVLQEYSRLGLTNPLSIAWEKVPYSFVADWFLPVGSWVDTFDATNYLHFTEGSETQMVRVSLESSQLDFNRPNSAYGNVSYTRHRPPTYEAIQFARNVLYTWPSASFPSLRNPLSLDKMAKGLALLTQVMKGTRAGRLRLDDRSGWDTDTD